MRNSTLAQDVVLAERFGYDYIEIRLDMLQEWLQKHTLSELADIFAVGHLKPWGYNSLEDITFCDSESWAERQKKKHCFTIKLSQNTSSNNKNKKSLHDFP